jgi:hypothetical protein
MIGAIAFVDRFPDTEPDNFDGRGERKIKNREVFVKLDASSSSYFFAKINLAVIGGYKDLSHLGVTH